MKIYVKHMVSHRCILVVRYYLEQVGIPYSSVQLGEVETVGDVPREKIEQLGAQFTELGLSLMDDKKQILVEQIKTSIINQIHHCDQMEKMNFSDFLSKKLGYNYTYLANIFSESEGVTIERFVIVHKIERVKELLIYDELNLTEISYKMNYSSVSHLSYQFKKVTGFSPSFFKQMRHKRRHKLENL